MENGIELDEVGRLTVDEIKELFPKRIGDRVKLREGVEKMMGKASEVVPPTPWSKSNPKTDKKKKQKKEKMQKMRISNDNTLRCLLKDKTRKDKLVEGVIDNCRKFNELLFEEKRRSMPEWQSVECEKAIIFCPFCDTTMKPQIRKSKNQTWNLTNVTRHLNKAHPHLKDITPQSTDHRGEDSETKSIASNTDDSNENVKSSCSLPLEKAAIHTFSSGNIDHTEKSVDEQLVSTTDQSPKKRKRSLETFINTKRTIVDPERNTMDVSKIEFLNRNTDTEMKTDADPNEIVEDQCLSEKPDFVKINEISAQLESQVCNQSAMSNVINTVTELETMTGNVIIHPILPSIDVSQVCDYDKVNKPEILSEPAHEEHAVLDGAAGNDQLPDRASDNLIPDRHTISSLLEAVINDETELETMIEKEIIEIFTDPIPPSIDVLQDWYSDEVNNYAETDKEKVGSVLSDKSEINCDDTSTNVSGTVLEVDRSGSADKETIEMPPDEENAALDGEAGNDQLSNQIDDNLTEDSDTSSSLKETVPHYERPGVKYGWVKFSYRDSFAPGFMFEDGGIKYVTHAGELSDTKYMKYLSFCDDIPKPKKQKYMDGLLKFNSKNGHSYE